MKERKLIQKIDKYRFMNYNNINPIFLNQSYDLYNDYSLPFLSTIVVIAVNRDKIDDEIKGYNDLLNSKYKNDIVLLDDQRIIIGASLLANGYDMNTTKKEELNDAKEWLLKLKENIKAYDSDSPKTFLITNEVDLGVIWNAEALIAKDYNENIEIIYPKDGFAISLDNYAIVKGAKNKENVYKFIDYLLRDEVNKKITDEYPYINTTLKNSNLSKNELLNILRNGSYVKNIGSNISNYDKIWAEIK